MNAPGEPPEAAGVAPAYSPLEAVTDLRATAKWILAAAAAVGAALLGGGPLTAVGTIQDVPHAVAAFSGLLLGLLGVGWAIWFTADALIPPLTTPASLDTEPALADLRARIAREPAAFYGPFGTSAAELGRRLAFHQKVAANLAELLATDQDPARRQVLALHRERADAAVLAARRRLRALSELAHAWQVRAQLRRARLHALAGAAVTAAGAVIFLVATGGNGTDAVPGAPAVPTATAEVRP
ncbi:hypothetical protein ABZ917_41810 [Nonomuraea wenchangensis]